MPRLWLAWALRKSRTINNSRGGRALPMRLRDPFRGDTPCSPEVLKQHLQAFVDSFMKCDSRYRASILMFRRSRKQPHVLKDLYKLLDERFSSPPTELRLPKGLPTNGVFF